MNKNLRLVNSLLMCHFIFLKKEGSQLVRYLLFRDICIQWYIYREVLGKIALKEYFKNFQRFLLFCFYVCVCLPGWFWAPWVLSPAELSLSCSILFKLCSSSKDKKREWRKEFIGYCWNLLPNTLSNEEALCNWYLLGKRKSGFFNVVKWGISTTFQGRLYCSGVVG